MQLVLYCNVITHDIQVITIHKTCGFELVEPFVLTNVLFSFLTINFMKNSLLSQKYASQTINISLIFKTLGGL